MRPSEPSRNTDLVIPAIVALVIVWIPVEIFDEKLFLFLNGLNSTARDILWLGITVIGDGLVLGILLGMFLAWNPRVTALGLTLLIVSSLIVHACKAAFPSLRPPELLDTVHVVGPLLRSGSFPSGHAVAGMAAALAVAHYQSSKVISVIILTAGFLIGASRVFVGVHFPGDVISGILITLLTYVAFRRFALNRMEALVPEIPSFSSHRFLAFFIAELLVVFFVVLIYADRFEEMGFLVRLIGCLILLIFFRAWLTARIGVSRQVDQNTD